MVSFWIQNCRSSHAKSIAVSVSSKLGIMRKASCLFDDPVLVSRCFLELRASYVRVLLYRLNVCCSFSYWSALIVLC